MTRKGFTEEVLFELCHGTKGRWPNAAGRQERECKGPEAGGGRCAEEMKDNPCEWCSERRERGMGLAWRVGQRQEGLQVTV